MNSHSSGRNQRPKGFKYRWAFQCALLVAACVWLLYQVKHSHDKNSDYGSNLQSKLRKGHVSLGRKGNAGWSSIEEETGSDDVDPAEGGERRRDGGAGDDKLDRNFEEKAGEESYNKDNDTGLGDHDAAMEREREGRYKEFQEMEDTESRSQVEVKSVNMYKDVLGEEYYKAKHEIAKGSTKELDDQRGEEVLETKGKSTENAEKNHDGGLGQGKDGSFEDSDEEEGHTEAIGQLYGVPNATSPSLNEMYHGSGSFHDENGVPLDVLESTPTENNSLNNENGSTGRMEREGEEVKPTSRTNTVDPEAESVGAFRDLKIDRKN